MRRAAWILLALTAAAPTALAKKAPPKAPEAPPAEGVHLERVDGGTRLDAVLPGWLRGYALPRRVDGSRDVVLLVGTVRPATVKKQDEKPTTEAVPCDGADVFEAARTAPTKLIRLDPSGNGALEVLRDDLPADARSLEAFDLDGDGNEELLIFLPGEIRSLRDADGKRFARGPEPLVSDASLGYGTREPRVVRSPAVSGTLFPIATTEGLHAYGRLADGAFGLVSSTPLPVSTSISGRGIRVVTPYVTEIGAGRGGAPVLAASGDGGGEIRSDRLRSVLLDPAAEPPRRSVDCWSKLPAREWLHDRFYRSLDGHPAMIVTTSSADKLKIFGEKWLRVFLLEEDRTKAGKAPILAADIGASLWQPVEPTLLDVNGDGRTDLVVAYWKGLKKAAVSLDVFLRKEDGGFEPSPRETTIDAEDGDRSVLEYGRDIDGDGAADLVLLAAGKIVVFRGVNAPPKGEGIVAATPRYTLPLPSFPSFAPSGGVTVSIGSDGMSSETYHPGLGTPRPIDLDGDGRPEILIEATLKDGRSAIVIFRLATQR